VALLKRMLPQLGINAERLRLEWVSASEAQKFAELVKSFTATITALGPLPAGPAAREEVHAQA